MSTLHATDDSQFYNTEDGSCNLEQDGSQAWELVCNFHLRLVSCGCEIIK